MLLLSLSLCVGIPAAAHGQTNPPSSVRCPSPADPWQLYFECRGRPFDFIEETLTKDWAGFRTELNRAWDHADRIIYDPTPGQSKRRTVTGFTYAGTLQASIFWDLAQAPAHSGPFVQHRRRMVHRQEPFGRLYRQQFYGSERVRLSGERHE